MALGYAEHSGSGVTLRRLADGKPLDDDDHIRGLLLSRLDFDVHILSIPRIAEREAEGLIRYRLRSIYPGSPADTAFDYRLESDATRHNAVIFLARKGTLAEYKAAAGQRPLSLPYVLVRGIARAYKDVRVCFCQARWAELSVFQGGLLVSCTVLRREKGAFGLSQFGASSDDPTPLPRLVVIASSEDIARFGTGEGATDRGVEFLSFQELESRLRKVDGLFNGHDLRHSAPAPMVRIAAVTAIVAVLGSLVFLKRVRMAEDEAAHVKAMSFGLENQAAKIRALQDQADSYGAELARMSSAQPQDLYLFLSELTVVLGADVRIQDFRVDGNSFQIEAVGSNPLKTMEGFRRSAVFSDVRLSQVTPDARQGKERFSFSGTLHAR